MSFQNISQQFRQAANISQITGIDIFDCDNDASEYKKLSYDLNERLSGSGLKREVFHLINSRFLANGINTDRWPSLIEDCRELLVPGGWLQMVEPVWQFQSDLGEDLPCLKAWWNQYAEALRSMQKNARVGRNLFNYMAQANFQCIKADTRNVPAAGWKDGESEPTHFCLYHQRLTSSQAGKGKEQTIPKK